MVGGVIIGLTYSTRDGNQIIHVNVADCPHYPKHGRGDECPRPDTCCVYTDGLLKDGTEADLQIGDSFWWQGGKCYWTEKDYLESGRAGKGGKDYDIELTKIGYSH